MRTGCHSLVFGALAPEDALIEVARAGFETTVLAEIEGQAQHGSALKGVPLVPVVAVDIAAHETRRVRDGLAVTAWLGADHLITTSGGRPDLRGTLRSPGPPSQSFKGLARCARSAPETRLAVMPRGGSAVWNVATALQHVQRYPEIVLWPDTSHLARAGEDLPAAARALAPYSAGWFIRDHAGTGAGPGEFEAQVPGRGILDLPGTLTALQGAGFPGSIIFHAVGHLPGGSPRPEYPLQRLRALAREARDYLSRYCTSSAERPT